MYQMKKQKKKLLFWVCYSHSHTEYFYTYFLECKLYNLRALYRDQKAQCSKVGIEMVVHLAQRYSPE